MSVDDDEMKDFIVQDDDSDSDGSESYVEKSESESENESESEGGGEEVEESDESDKCAIDKKNIVTGKRRRVPTRRYAEDVFSSPEYREMMLSDVPASEIDAALVDENLSDDEDYSDDDSDGDSDDDDESAPSTPPPPRTKKRSSGR